MKLLNNGLQYSIEQPPLKYSTNIIMETEQAIKLIDAKMQNPLRILAAKKLRQIFTSDSHQNSMHKRQAYTIKT